MSSIPTMNNEPVPPPPFLVGTEKFRLKNVLNDSSLLKKGLDLKDLQVSMDDPEKLGTKSASPFVKHALDPREQPEFSLPACYIISKPILRIKMIGLFCTGTLFYIFYNMPGEMLQALAAEELYRRDWQYCPATGLWYFEASGAWKMFDLDQWDVVACVSSIPSGFLSKEEVRVKKVTA